MLCLGIGYHTPVYYYTFHAGIANVSAKNVQVIKSNVYTIDTNILRFTILQNCTYKEL
jgi:hypothetical protein